jgi:gamma-butyrobetaine dioxygenase
VSGVATDAVVGAASLANGVVRVELTNGTHGSLHALTLRDGCPCAECRHPVSGQRLFESSQVLPRANVAAVRISDAGLLELDWADGHRSRYQAAWIDAEASAAERGRRPARRVRAWGDAPQESLPEHRWPDVADDDAARIDWLRDVAELGFAILHGVPCHADFVERIASLFGAVRETNYGRVFDVSVAVDATNLADTALPLSPHTDNPYRDPTPTVQLLHCLASDVAGGLTVLVDGFAAAGQLRAEAPERLELLARTPIRYAYRDGDTDLETDVPVVTVDAYGDVVALHLNNRSKGIPYGAPADVARWYDAYLALVGLVESSERQLVFRLEPGDLIVFDNLRVLHGRTGFAGEGTRRLQGCYADRDGLHSRLAVLERGTT